MGAPSGVLAEGVRVNAKNVPVWLAGREVGGEVAALLIWFNDHFGGRSPRPSPPGAGPGRRRPTRCSRGLQDGDDLRVRWMYFGLRSFGRGQ